MSVYSAISRRESPIVVGLSYLPIAPISTPEWRRWIRRQWKDGTTGESPRKAETPCVGSLRNRMGRANVVVRIIDAARR
jgi:hypothetical protein